MVDYDTLITAVGFSFSIGFALGCVTYSIFCCTNIDED